MIVSIYLYIQISSTSVFFVFFLFMLLRCLNIDSSWFHLLYYLTEDKSFSLQIFFWLIPTAYFWLAVIIYPRYSKFSIFLVMAFIFLCHLYHNHLLRKLSLLHKSNINVSFYVCIFFTYYLYNKYRFLYSQFCDSRSKKSTKMFGFLIKKVIWALLQVKSYRQWQITCIPYLSFANSVLRLLHVTTNVWIINPSFLCFFRK